MKQRFLKFWEGLNAQQRKLFVFALLVAAGVLFLFAPSPSALLSGAVGVSAHAKPSPSHYAAPMMRPPQPLAPAPTLPPVHSAEASVSPALFVGDVPAPRLLGTWLGGGLLASRNSMCRLALELRMSKDKPGMFSGYSTTTCGPSLDMAHPTPEKQRQNFLQQMTPISTILTGSVVDGSIQFHVDQQIGSVANGCGPVTSFRVTPFGNANIAAQWEEQGCAAQNMILQRAGNAP